MIPENRVKRVVLTRNGSRGGRTAAIMASLASSCRRHDVVPPPCLTQLLVNLPATSIPELEEEAEGKAAGGKNK